MQTPHISRLTHTSEHFLKASMFLVISAMVKKFRLADILLQTLGCSSTSLSELHSAIFNLTLADNFFKIGYDDSFMSVHYQISQHIMGTTKSS